MGVDVDEARGHEQPVRVDLAAPRTDVVSERGDAVAVDREIGDPGGATGTIHEVAVADHQIVHVATLVLPVRELG